MLRSCRLLTVPAALAAASIGFAACGSSSKSSTSRSPTASNSGSKGGTTGGLTIQGIAFNPSTINAAGGSTVSITNKAGLEPTVTADDGSSFSVDVKGDSAKLTAPSKAGSYAFHCQIHTTMHG